MGAGGELRGVRVGRRALHEQDTRPPALRRRVLLRAVEDRADERLPMRYPMSSLSNET